MNECILCDAPGGYPYCNDDCRDADQDDTPTITATDFGPLAAITDPWATDARNYQQEKPQCASPNPASTA